VVGEGAARAGPEESLVDEPVEQRLDTFLIEVTAWWRALLRWISAGTAAARTSSWSGLTRLPRGGAGMRR